MDVLEHAGMPLVVDRAGPADRTPEDRVARGA
jgi:hypothetical protein